MSNESTVFERLFNSTTTVHADTRRQYAVACALELIKAHAASDTAGKRLESDMDNLSKFADQIEAALKVKS
ncbi:hypothetical protein DI392_00865 [Vibrio albus]|uniref:Uncharacterized protein n=1 Tax=Vibrio albus TaxID=2200953 RepID=A0A2U3BDL6_9VIBR|nr:hypothetical protein [Vibrio albus]PWI34865.1 hypothetical protein DI392_00865 [Vibrio albus]